MKFGTNIMLLDN